MATTEPTSWTDDRTGWSAMRASMAARRVRGGDPAYYVGGALAFLLLLQVASGILLMLHYQPGAKEAYPSALYIVGGLPYGELVRNLHLWSGDLLIVGVVLQLYSVIWRRTYRAPNELVWVTGLVVLFTLVALAFTGVVLPWSQSAYVQARVGSEIAGQTPLIGSALRHLLRGGDEVTTATLRTAYGFHVAVLPGALTLLLAVHALVLRAAAARKAPEPIDPARTIPVYPDFLVRQAAVLTALFVLVMTLATFAGRPLDEPANPMLATPAGSRPPWYFLFVHQLLRAAPPDLLGVDSPKFIVGAGAVLALAAFFIPFFDRRGSRITIAIATVLLALAFLLSGYALL